MYQFSANLPIRKLYVVRFVARCAAFAASILLYFFSRSQFMVLSGFQFFRKFSWLHLLWGVWMFDMLSQMIPARWALAMGSQKLFRRYYRPSRLPADPRLFREEQRRANRGAVKVLVLWAALIAVSGVLRFTGVLSVEHLFLFAVFFYVCDLICVLFWCPFKAFLMKNRCCTTCRIFNWDHLMMFSPLALIPSFFTWSLFAMSVAVFVMWEVKAFRYPERFSERTNLALRCSECRDLLCGRKQPPAALCSHNCGECASPCAKKTPHSSCAS